MGRKVEIVGWLYSLLKNTLPGKVGISTPKSKVRFPLNASHILRSRKLPLSCSRLMLPSKFQPRSRQSASRPMLPTLYEVDNCPLLAPTPGFLRRWFLAFPLSKLPLFHEVESVFFLVPAQSFRHCDEVVNGVPSTREFPFWAKLS